MITFANLYYITLTGGIHAILFIIIMSLLYFLILVRFKNDIVSDFIAKGAIKYGLDNIDISMIPKYNSFLEILKKEADKEQESFKEHNNKLKMKTITLIITIIVIYIIFMTLMPKLFQLKEIKFNYYKLFKETSLIILIVGTYELLFLKYIVLDYTFYNFHEFLYKYISNNTSNIKRFMPSILLHFMIDIPEYKQFIPNSMRNLMYNNIKDKISNKVSNKMINQINIANRNHEIQ